MSRVGVVVVAGVGVVVVLCRVSHGGTPKYCMTLYKRLPANSQFAGANWHYSWKTVLVEEKGGNASIAGNCHKSQATTY